MSEDRQMLVNDITFALGSIQNVALTGLSAMSNKGKAQVTVQVQVPSINQINEIINKLGAIDGVLSVFRK